MFLVSCTVFRDALLLNSSFIITRTLIICERDKVLSLKKNDRDFVDGDNLIVNVSTSRLGDWSVLKCQLQKNMHSIFKRRIDFWDRSKELTASQKYAGKIYSMIFTN